MRISSPARLKVDEDLPADIAKLFIASGHDATTVTAQGWSGIADEKLWPRVQGEGRWLVTGDKGFADLRRYSPGVLTLV
jgi:predicted nuclease of predicted toxin-antitoxin system